MTTGEQSNKKSVYDQEYKKANYDNILVRIKKGKREEYTQAAAELGLGQAEMIRLAIEEYIANHGGEIPASTSKPESISVADKRLVEEFNQLPVDAQKSLMKFLKVINQNMP